MKVNVNSLSGALKRQRREAAAGLVFAAAEAVLAREGFERATMQEIAREAGCAAGTLYLYFKSKEELLNELVARHLRQLEAAYRDLVARTPDALEQLRLGVLETLRYCGAHQAVFGLWCGSALGGRSDLPSPLRGAALEAYQALRKLDLEAMRRAQEAGAVRKDIPAEELVELMHGLCNAVLARWSASRAGPEIETRMRVLWSFLTGGLGVPAGRTGEGGEGHERRQTG
jgi:AcrR family transcriptional regulator